MESSFLSLDIPAPFYYINMGRDKARRVWSYLVALKTSGLSEILIASIDKYLATTDS
jgi:hypothetical protein